jgi:hypothetical protein
MLYLVRTRSSTGTIKDCFEPFLGGLLTLNGHPMIQVAVVAPISHDLILGQTLLYDTNPVIDWKKRTLTFERDQRPLATQSEAPEPTRCELLTAKQFSRMLRKEKVHCYALFLDETLAQTCMNGSEESLECLKLEVIEDLTEVFPTELPKTKQANLSEILSYSTH